jgi:hypothetical protein
MSTYAERTPAHRYYTCSGRLDEAILKNDGKRVRLLRYAQDILADETRQALELERQRIRSMVDEMFAPIFQSFKHTH